MLYKATSIDEFMTMNTLGTGSYGAVKLSKHKLTDQMVAIKMTHKNHAAKDQARAKVPLLYHPLCPIVRFTLRPLKLTQAVHPAPRTHLIVVHDRCCRIWPKLNIQSRARPGRS